MTKTKSNTITIQDFLKAIKYKISGGQEYLWECFGPNAHFLDYESGQIDKSAHIIYDTKTQRVFNCEVWIGDKVYRWFNKGCRSKCRKEAQARHIKPDIAIDNLKYTEVSNASQILKILKNIVTPKKKKV